MLFSKAVRILRMIENYSCEVHGSGIIVFFYVSSNVIKFLNGNLQETNTSSVVELEVICNS